jgi:hypothetical protein
MIKYTHNLDQINAARGANDPELVQAMKDMRAMMAAAKEALQAEIKQRNKELSLMKKDELLRHARRLTLQNIDLRRELRASYQINTAGVLRESQAREQTRLKQGKGRDVKAARNAAILEYAKEQFRLYRNLDMSVKDARNTAMIDVGDEFKKKNGKPETRGRTWISQYLKD